MVSAAKFDRLHGSGAFARLRSMLKDPALSYETIGQKLGFSKQRISQLAKELGVDVAERRRQRRLTRPLTTIVKSYSPSVEAVIRKIKRRGLQVLPYDARIQSVENLYWRSQTKVLVNGILCAVQVHSERIYRPNGRCYARFEVGPKLKKAKVAVLGIRKDSAMPLYVVPTKDLRNIDNVYIPANGKYGTFKKPRKDWSRYQDAWHLLRTL